MTIAIFLALALSGVFAAGYAFASGGWLLFIAAAVVAVVALALTLLEAAVAFSRHCEAMASAMMEHEP